MVRRGHLIAVVVTFLMGCAFLLLIVGCSGTPSETSKKEQGRSPEATASEEARCGGTTTTKNPMAGTGGGPYTTNDLPGCPKGGLLLGTDKNDRLHGKEGDDEIRGLGGDDEIFSGPGNDDIYAGPGDDFVMRGDYRYETAGDDVVYGGSGDDDIDGGDGADVIYGGDGNDLIWAFSDDQPDKLYCGTGKDKYAANKNDYVSSSCEKKANLEPPPSDSNLSKPPDSTLSYGRREVKGTLGSYCWFSGGEGVCADTFSIVVPSKQKTLTVPSDSKTVFHYGGQSPLRTVEATAVTLNKKGDVMYRSHRKLKAHGSGVERTIPVDLRPGEYVVGVDIVVQQNDQQNNDASYTFRVMVE